ncbi:hypothetical protein Ahy_B08g091983 [Arachis hypogaea]|uniref:Uncharacterized protein n=1 Tax=Arachis hypogaea TaxID=3818 RepID=A0A444Y2W0_ARAHY|nr:hypothetical protein Ahy_B08g091983 [Arachis hypogaea]
MARIKRINKDACGYLCRFEPYTWSKSNLKQISGLLCQQGMITETNMSKYKFGTQDLHLQEVASYWNSMQTRNCINFQDKNHRPEDYVHEWLWMTSYNFIYQSHMNSIPSAAFWEKSQRIPPLPPIYKRPIRRPTKKRKQDKEVALTKKYKLKRKYGTTTCQWCK